MRIVIAEDAVLLREGLAGLLEDAGHASSPGSATPIRSSRSSPSTIPTLRSSTSACRRPTRTKACAQPSRFAGRIRGTGVLVLSQHVESRFALELVSSDGPSATC